MKVNFKQRLRARQLNIRKRFMSITAKEQTYIQKLTFVAIGFLGRSRDPDISEDDRNKYSLVGRTCYLKALKLASEPAIQIPKPLRFDITFDSFSESNCWVFFKLRSCDLERVFKCLRIPEVVILPNRSSMSGVEVFLRGLYELVSGEDQYNICENVFGREQSQQSRAFSWFINHLDETFYDILSDNLEWWKNKGFLEQSRQAITRKLEELGLLFTEEDPQRVAAFIDCNCLETSRVAGGPMSGNCFCNILANR